MSQNSDNSVVQEEQAVQEVIAEEQVFAEEQDEEKVPPKVRTKKSPLKKRCEELEAENAELKEKIAELNDKIIQCPICWGDLLKTDAVITECGHSFHYKCLKQVKPLKCPMCREGFTPEIFGDNEVVVEEVLGGGGGGVRRRRVQRDNQDFRNNNNYRRKMTEEDAKRVDDAIDGRYRFDWSPDYKKSAGSQSDALYQRYKVGKSFLECRGLGMKKDEPYKGVLQGYLTLIPVEIEDQVEGAAEESESEEE